MYRIVKRIELWYEPSNDVEYCGKIKDAYTEEIDADEDYKIIKKIFMKEIVKDTAPEE